MIMKLSPDYFLKPVIVDTVPSPTLHERPGVATAPPVQFGVYIIRINKLGGAAYDNGTLIASIGQLNELIVAENYRNKGIAKALIVAWARANPNFRTRRIPVRTPIGAQVYKVAYIELNKGD